MRLLIVSSEPLNPGNKLPSCFELSQAQLLAGAGYDVAILSVGFRPRFTSEARVRLRHLFNDPGLKTLTAVVAAARLLPMRRVRRHHIEGVAVFEGLAVNLEQSFEVELASWLEAAFMAYDDYVKINGIPSVIHAHGRFLNAGAFALAADVPYVYTEHSSFYCRGRAPDAARPVLRRVIERSGVYTTVSSSLARAVNAFLAVETRPPIITPNTIDPLFERTAPRDAPPTDPFIFGCVASLDKNKAVGLLIEAFARAFNGDASYRLEICGEGSLRSNLEEQARELGVDAQVRFHGRIDKSQVLELIDGSHSLVLNSYVETFGVVLIEAMCRGRPVIATRCGGPEEFVDSDNGMLVPTGDQARLTEALRDMTNNYRRFNPEVIRARAVATYGEAAFLQRMNQVYRAAIA